MRPGATITTTCAEFDCGMGCLALSAFALRDAVEPALVLERLADGARLSARRRTWTLRFPDMRTIAIRETGAEHVIPF